MAEKLWKLMYNFIINVWICTNFYVLLLLSG